MREILFKAKRIDNGKWIFGDLLHNNTGKVFIKPIYGSAKSSLEIVPETVCQYTGLTGSNRKIIWENDIVAIIWHSGKIERYLIWWCKEMSMMKAISLNDISFNGNDYWGGQPQIEYSTFCLMMQDPWGDIKEIKVIGNIFDNPKLLKL